MSANPSRREAITGIALISTFPDSAAAQVDPSSFVLIERGDLPIIISAPHGGRDALPGTSIRQRGGPFNAVVTRDENTLELAMRLAPEIAARLGRKPHLVAARFERRYADANRQAAEAYEPPGADGPQQVYDAYHVALRAAHADVRRRFERGLLIDLHGQGLEPGTLFRGTANGRTVAGIVGRAGIEGPASLFGVMAAKGYTVHPALGSNGPEHPGYTGGYIVRTYGGGAVDAIQLEFGATARSGFALGRTAEDVADAVAAHARAFLGVG